MLSFVLWLFQLVYMYGEPKFVTMATDVVAHGGRRVRKRIRLRRERPSGRCAAQHNQLDAEIRRSRISLNLNSGVDRLEIDSTFTRSSWTHVLHQSGHALRTCVSYWLSRNAHKSSEREHALVHHAQYGAHDQVPVAAVNEDRGHTARAEITCPCSPPPANRPCCWASSSEDRASPAKSPALFLPRASARHAAGGLVLDIWPRRI